MLTQATKRRRNLLFCSVLKSRPSLPKDSDKFMDRQTYNSNISFGYDFFDPFSHSFSCGGSVFSQSHSLVLDTEKRELVKAPTVTAKKTVVSREKAMAALKNHSEAERRRRERINSHLATLRGLVPSTEKMDKATLLAEIISQVKELKKNAIQVSKGLLIPMDTDEVTVEPCVVKSGDNIFSFKASLCCEFQSNLLSEVRQALEALPLKLAKVEICSAGGRLKSEFVLTSHTAKSCSGKAQKTQQIFDSVHHALSSVLEKTSSSLEYLPRSANPNKRRRISSSNSASSSSL